MSIQHMAFGDSNVKFIYDRLFRLQLFFFFGWISYENKHRRLHLYHHYHHHHHTIASLRRSTRCNLNFSVFLWLHKETLLKICWSMANMGVFDYSLLNYYFWFEFSWSVLLHWKCVIAIILRLFAFCIPLDGHTFSTCFWLTLLWTGNGQENLQSTNIAYM